MTQDQKELPEVLKSVAEICSLHAQRLKMALEKTASVFPLTPESFESLSDEQLGFLEMLSSRFAKLQDLMGVKLFPLTLELLEESGLTDTAIDRFNKLEKLGWLPSADRWRDFRKLRNRIAHEYPEHSQRKIEALNDLPFQAAELLSYWEGFKARLMRWL